MSDTCDVCGRVTWGWELPTGVSECIANQRRRDGTGAGPLAEVECERAGRLAAMVRLREVIAAGNEAIASAVYQTPDDTVRFKASLDAWRALTKEGGKP